MNACERTKHHYHDSISLLYEWCELIHPAQLKRNTKGSEKYSRDERVEMKNDELFALQCIHDERLEVTGGGDIHLQVSSNSSITLATPYLIPDGGLLEIQ